VKSQLSDDDVLEVLGLLEVLDVLGLESPDGELVLDVPDAGVPDAGVLDELDLESLVEDSLGRLSLR
jgi:hypothetical protein